MQSKTAGKAERIYIDSNVWYVYLTKGKYENHKAKFDNASYIIDDLVVNQNNVAVISHLVILEMLNIFRTKVLQREGFQGKLSQKPEIEKKLRTTIERLSATFIDKITEWAEAGKLIITKINTPTTEFLQSVVELHRPYFGTITDRDCCKICNRPRESYDYRGVDHYDLQHALIAKTAKVDRLATFDHGYKDLTKNPNFEGLKFDIY